jgi:sirohydrochlorin ferrochelatase
VNLGIVIFAHGSVIESANESVRDVTERLATAGGFDLVEPAFLELGRPDLGQAIGRLIERGAGRIIVVPYFLTLGKHLQRDLPRIVEGISRIHQGVPIVVTAPLEGHPALVMALLDRAREAAAAP